MRARLQKLSVIGVVAGALLFQFAAPSWRASAQTTSFATDGSVLDGRWRYRSFHNNPSPVTDSEEEMLDLYFAEAEFTFEIGSDGSLSGKIDWTGGGLDLKGTVKSATADAPLTVDIVGEGRQGTSTEGWEYDYHGHLAHRWPDGVDQAFALVGSVIRAKPHGADQAGYVASFIAVKE